MAENNVTNINNCYTTPVVDQISSASIYVDPGIWSKIITYKSGKPHWLGIHLFARILYWYQRTEVRNEVTGQLIGYKKKFKYDKLQISYKQIQAQMGCTEAEAHSALTAILDSNLVTQELRDIPGYNNVMFIEPIPENILCIMHPKGVHKETPPPAEKGSPSPIQKGETPPAEKGTNTLSTTSTSETLFSTKEHIEDGQSVDNSEQLPTDAPIPNKQQINKDNLAKLKTMLSQATQAVTRHKEGKDDNKAYR